MPAATHHFSIQKATATVTLHLTTFEGDAHGISALSDFRVQQLLPRLQAIHDKIVGISARFVHLVATEAAPPAALQSRLAALLRYGEPCGEPVGSAADSVRFIVSPRFGTVSPWASKATDIAHNCGLAVKRIERITEYRVTLKSGFFSKSALSETQREQVAALLHDRMLESVVADRAQAEAGLFTELQGAPLQTIDVLHGGKAARLALRSAEGAASVATRCTNRALMPTILSWMACRRGRSCWTRKSLKALMPWASPSKVVRCRVTVAVALWLSAGCGRLPGCSLTLNFISDGRRSSLKQVQVG